MKKAVRSLYIATIALMLLLLCFIPLVAQIYTDTWNNTPAWGEGGVRLEVFVSMYVNLYITFVLLGTFVACTLYWLFEAVVRNKFGRIALGVCTIIFTGLTVVGAATGILLIIMKDSDLPKGKKIVKKKQRAPQILQLKHTSTPKVDDSIKRLK